MWLHISTTNVLSVKENIKYYHGNNIYGVCTSLVNMSSRDEFIQGRVSCTLAMMPLVVWC